MKKILTMALIFLFVLSIGVTVYATTGNFDFYLYSNEIGETSFETKDDAVQKLYIRLNEVQLYGCCEYHDYIFWFRGRNINNTAVTNAGDWNLWEDDWEGELRNLPYTSYQAAGTSIKLRGQTDEDSSNLRMIGRWTP